MKLRDALYLMSLYQETLNDVVKQGQLLEKKLSPHERAMFEGEFRGMLFKARELGEIDLCLVESVGWLRERGS